MTLPEVIGIDPSLKATGFCGSDGTTFTTRPRRPRVNSTIPGARANSVSSRPMPTPSPALKRLPRWRTMISPPVTTSPAKTFTPRR